MEYNNNSSICNIFGVPCIVADNFLKISSGEQIKVLLYILRNSDKNITVKEISNNTGIAPQEVESCIKWWQDFNIIPDQNIINQEFNNVSDTMTAQFISPVMTPAPVITTAAEVTPKPEPTKIKRNILSPNEVTSVLIKNPDMKQLFDSLRETIPFFNDHIQDSIIWIHEYYGLKIEVINVLINYCCTINSMYSKYIEELAKKWYDKGIHTMEEACEEVKFLEYSRTFTFKIISLFEMKRNPTTTQQDFIDSWQKADYDIELIRYAYEITIENTEKLSFPYINKILVSWHNNGINTFEKAKNAVAERKNSYKSKTDNSDGFDADKYEIVINNF